MFDESDYELILILLEQYKKVLENFIVIDDKTEKEELLKNQFPFNLDLEVINICLDKYKKIITTSETVKY